MTMTHEHVIMRWDPAEASAPIFVDDEGTQYQTASARHRTDLAVALVCRAVWPDVDWPGVPDYGSIGELEPNWRGWDEMSYETIAPETIAPEAEDRS